MGQSAAGPSAARFCMMLPAAPGWQRTRVTLYTGRPVSMEISARAGSMSK
jgi:hypothetical protein